MMGWKRLLRMILASVLSAMPLTLAAQQTPSTAIQQVLKAQADAWNRGDVVTFMQAYKDSPDTTFIGKSVEHGYAPILERYKKAYPGKDAMGVLTYSDFAVRELGATYAVVTGRFHLARNAAGGGDASGIFSLVWEKTPQGWKIILDHTSADSTAKN